MYTDQQCSQRQIQKLNKNSMNNNENMDSNMDTKECSIMIPRYTTLTDNPGPDKQNNKSLDRKNKKSINKKYNKPKTSTNRVAKKYMR